MKPSSVGVSGTKVTFMIGGRTYQTGAINPTQAGALTVKEAEKLIANGQATAVDASYVAQFPWVNPPK